MFSSEHAPIALGASGNRVVIAESFARIFFRNCIATGELYPYETAERLVDTFSTGDEVCNNLYCESSQGGEVLELMICFGLEAMVTKLSICKIGCLFHI